MILTDYYKLVRLPEYEKNGVPRYDCISSTGQYPPFETIKQRSRVKRFFVALSNIPERFDRSVKCKADKAIINNANISSIFIFDIEKQIGYGDCNGTSDALLFRFSADRLALEIWVARGQKSNRVALCHLLLDGELDEDINELKEIADREL